MHTYIPSTTRFDSAMHACLTSFASYQPSAKKVEIAERYLFVLREGLDHDADSAEVVDQIHRLVCGMCMG